MDSNKNHPSEESIIVPQSQQKNLPLPHKKKRKFVIDFNIPGIHKVVVPEPVQEFIKCVVGDRVTTDKPWTYVGKESLQEHIEVDGEESPFHHLKAALDELPQDEVFMGYIPDESRNYDEFYVCVTSEATDRARELVEKVERLHESRLKSLVLRKCKKWTTLGSEEEISEEAGMRHRSLLEVEIESKYPIFPRDFTFLHITVKSMNQGYIEMKPSEEATSVVVRRRVSKAIQVIPFVVSKEVQTPIVYPKNSSSQYEYNAIELIEETPKSLEDFFSDNIETLRDILKVNNIINFYADDYANLAVGQRNYSPKELHPPISEYKAFVNLDFSKGKMISSIGWHEMWSGCFISSYVNVAPGIYISSKAASRETFDTNPVLFWSFDDDLRPKLILEAPRPVYSVSCCPYDPNLIVGGCVNGQIIIWDISNKLKNVEEEEILTMNQQKYRSIMFDLMQWMRNIFDKARVRPTAISDPKFPHGGCVNSISWMSPFHRVTNVGKIAEVEGNSRQIITSAEDGTVMIWDLLQKPARTPGGYRGMRRAQRLDKRPSVLVEMESPFRALHLRLKPVYKINLYSSSRKRTLSISCLHADFFSALYSASSAVKNTSISTRILYAPDLKIEDSHTRRHFYVGTMEGEYVQATWEGQQFDSGEIVNFEDAGVANAGRYHDGPIVKIDYAREVDAVLTVGGKIFALWRESFRGRPVFWRRCKHVYTDGGWFTFEKASIKLVRMDGFHEIWMIIFDSKTPSEAGLSSNDPISHLTSHPRLHTKKVFGYCNYRGVLRLFSSNPIHEVIRTNKETLMKSFLEHEIQRKTKFLSWQEEWNKRHSDHVTVEKAEREVSETEKAAKKKPVGISPGRRYLALMEEQHQKRTQERIREIILAKKQLRTADLEAQREPLQQLEREREERNKKQKNRLKQSEKIFKTQVEMLFPHFVTNSQTLPPLDPHSSNNRRKESFDEYLRIEEESKQFLEENVVQSEFSWKAFLKKVAERRKLNLEKYTHRRRYLSEKGKLSLPNIK